MTETEQERRPILAAVILADIRGYTDYSQRHGDEAAGLLVSRFRDRARAALGTLPLDLQFHGGDAMLALLPSAADALRASVELRRSFRAENAGDSTIPVGQGVSCGDVVQVDDGYEGSAIIIASRLCAMAEADEALADERVVEAAGEVEGLRSVFRGPLHLKGIHSPVIAYLAVGEDEPADGSPLYRVLSKLAEFHEENEDSMGSGIMSHGLLLARFLGVDINSEEWTITVDAINEALERGLLEQPNESTLRLTTAGWKYIRGGTPGSERDQEILGAAVAASRDPEVRKIQGRLISMEDVFQRGGLEWNIHTANNAARRLEEAGFVSVTPTMGAVYIELRGAAFQTHPHS